MVSNRPRRYLESILEVVAPFWLNMSPWRAMATPFMPIFIVANPAKVALSINLGPGRISQGKERPGHGEGGGRGCKYV